MANAKKCDRCGMLYERYGGIAINPQGCKYDGIVLVGQDNTLALDLCHPCALDLCHPCMTSLRAWLNEMEADNEPNDPEH